MATYHILKPLNRPARWKIVLDGISLALLNIILIPGLLISIHVAIGLAYIPIFFIGALWWDFKHIEDAKKKITGNLILSSEKLSATIEGQTTEMELTSIARINGRKGYVSAMTGSLYTLYLNRYETIVLEVILKDGTKHTFHVKNPAAKSAEGLRKASDLLDVLTKRHRIKTAVY